MAVLYGLPTSKLIQRKTPPSDFVPKNFAEMYQHYYVYVLRLLVKQGIDYQDADDIAQTLFIKMDEKGMLSSFDPEHGARDRPAVFTTLLSGFVLKYMRHYRHRQIIQQSRELTYIDQDTALAKAWSGENDTSTLNTWIDVYGPTFEEEYAEVHDDDFRRAIREHLSSVPKGRKDSQLDLVDLFNEIDRQVALDGKYNTSDLMEKFCVTRTTIHNWLEKLRIEVSKAVEAHG